MSMNRNQLVASKKKNDTMLFKASKPKILQNDLIYFLLYIFQKQN